MNRTELIAARDLANEAYTNARAVQNILGESGWPSTIELAKQTANKAWELLLALDADIREATP